MQTKQPAEVLTVPYDFAAKLRAATIASIVSVAAEPRAGGSALVAEDQQIVGSEVRVTWSGGSDGETYLATIVVADSSGQQLEIEGDIAVIDGAWTMPDGGAPYLDIKSFVDRFGLDEIVRATDTAGDGRIDRALLVKALTDTQAIIDVYVSARYAVPLATVPAIVEVAMADMARARLYSRGAPEGIDAASKAALQMIRDIGAGKVPLPSPGLLEPTSEPDAPVLVSPGCRQYPDRLKGY